MCSVMGEGYDGGFAVYLLRSGKIFVKVCWQCCRRFPHPFPAFGDSVARHGSRLRVAFACIVGENSVKEKWTIDDFRHP